MPASVPGRRVLLVGFDGMDWQVLRPLLARNELPTFARLIREGASGPLSTLEPTMSPILWNSIATGKRAGKHGIHGFTEVDPESGRVRPVSSTSRTCKAVWNILQQNGRQVNVVNWFAGHPAEPIDGVAVSPLFFEGAAGPGPGTIHPATLAPEWAELRVRLEEVDGELGRLFVRDIGKIDQAKDPRLGQLAGELARTFSIQTVALEAMQRAPWDFTAVYFRFTDILAHYFMPYHPPQMKGVPDVLFHHYQDVVNSSYRLADLLLRNLWHAAGEDATLLVLSDHGFNSDARRPQPQANPFANVERWHREHGVLLATGPGVRPGLAVSGAGLLDITPTLLTLFGLPVARDMDGRVLLELLTETGPLAWLDSWDRVPGADGRHPPGTQLAEMDATALLRQLEALGYIAPLGTDQVEAARQTRTQNRWNLARDYLDSGQDEAALVLLEEMHAEKSDNVAVTMNLALCQSRLDLHEEARLTAGDARRLTPEGPMLAAVLAPVAQRAGDTAEALKQYAAVVAGGAGSPAVHVEMARVHLVRREWERARAACAAALAIEPDYATAFLVRARVALLQGLPAEAVEQALAALERQHNLANAHLVLGRALLRLGRLEDARRALEAALVYQPRQARVHQALAVLHHQQGGDLLGELQHRADAQRILRSDENRGQRVARLRAAAAARRAARDSKVWAETESIESLEKKLRQNIQARLDSGAERGWTLEAGQRFAIVSGLPRAGTSVMMQMLAAGGLPAMTDGRRAADEDNPEGYFEWEEMLRLPERPWAVEKCLGKVVKVVSPLLAALPDRHRYQVVFMVRAAGEIARSQAAMLRRRGQPVPDDLERIAELQVEQAERTLAQLSRHPAFTVLRVPYREVVADAAGWSRRVAEFLAPVAKLNAAAMVTAVKPALYRNRATPAG